MAESQEDKFLKSVGYSRRNIGRPKKWDWNSMKEGDEIYVDSVLEYRRARGSAYAAGVKHYGDRCGSDSPNGRRYRITIGRRPSVIQKPLDPFSPASGPDDPRRAEPQVSDEHVNYLGDDENDRLRKQLKKSSEIFSRRSPKHR